MKKLPALATTLAVVLAALVLSGCSAVRYTSTLKPSGDQSLQYDDLRFAILGFGGESSKWLSETVDQKARALYPKVFTESWTGLPVQVDITSSYNGASYEVSAFITGFCTLGIIPIPGAKKHFYTVRTIIMNSQGEALWEKETGFEIHAVMWASAFPWGLLPVPGPSDLPRDSFWEPGAGYLGVILDKTNVYAAECIADIVAQSIRSADREQLESAYRERQSRLQEITLDGRRYRGLLTLSSFVKGKPADTAMVLIYENYPAQDEKPVDRAVVARLDESGRWQPVRSYLRSARTLTQASALIENNVPVRAVVRTPDMPPLEDFIDTPDLSGSDRAEILRWSNDVLLEAKNRSLENVLREENRDTLLDLATRIEKSILGLSSLAEQAKDRAQAMVEKGEGDPAPDRELSVLCRQRIEILKHILAAVKYAASEK